ncbi:hypothetical protein T265_05756 [Opisthorchis viverrini]|uniref:UBA domain-containing protein n=1 Tax=Opisthorchis viverrini TaxID=6198 RepID=A0A074ZUT8_OPIVI|nr:hypothetical protein T265_05756 [Opisthorchis viverrini]KER27140.1 hypothetical protein T265_05756 [Opisthorchis viverrini]
MVVFKIITPSERTQDKTEVTRWAVKDDWCERIWDEFIKLLQRIFNTKSSRFFISWYDGTDYCTVREFADLSQAVEFFTEEGSQDKAIRLFVSPDTTEHKTIFGEKPTEDKEEEEVENDTCVVESYELLETQDIQETEEEQTPEQPTQAEEVEECLARTTLDEGGDSNEVPTQTHMPAPAPVPTPAYPAMPMYPYMYTMNTVGQPIMYPQWPVPPVVPPLAPVPVPAVAPIAEPEQNDQETSTFSGASALPPVPASAQAPVPLPEPAPAPAPAPEPAPAPMPAPTPKPKNDPAYPTKLPVCPGGNKSNSKTSYVRKALVILRQLGFQQDDRTLKKLIKQHKGNLNAIIDALSSNC